MLVFDPRVKQPLFFIIAAFAAALASNPLTDWGVFSVEQNLAILLQSIAYFLLGVGTVLTFQFIKQKEKENRLGR